MTITSERVEQITLFLENRPGILADLCAHLADRGINIRAITTLESTETGAVRLVVDRAAAAKETLAEAGVPFTTSECLALEMPNTPGGFADIARILAIAGINIDFMYASSTPAAAVALGILGVSDLDRALSLDWEL
jgi:hypothetical protein